MIGRALALVAVSTLLMAQAPRGWGFQEDCSRRGTPRIGMNWQDLYDTCWGKPVHVNTTQTSHGSHDQLVYPKGNYIYLTHGVVTGIQTRR